MKKNKLIIILLIFSLLFIPINTFAADKCTQITKKATCKATDNCSWGKNGESKAHCYNKECNSLFGTNTNTGKYIHDLYNIIKFAVPILLLALSIKEFGGAVVAQNDNEIKKATKNFSKRLIIAVLILVLPTILNFFLNLLEIDTCFL